MAQRAKKMALTKEVNVLKKEFISFEEVMECFKQEQNLQDVNPLIHYSYLVLGCMGYLASFLIIFHTYALFYKVPFTTSKEMENQCLIC